MEKRLQDRTKALEDSRNNLQRVQDAARRQAEAKQKAVEQMFEISKRDL